MSTPQQDQGQGRVIIGKLPTGVAGLDEILGGGLPEYSFNIIAGAPGSGKTTLALQIMFANATPERPAARKNSRRRARKMERPGGKTK